MDTGESYAASAPVSENLSGLSLLEIELLKLRSARYARQERTQSAERPDAVMFERSGGRYAVLVTDLREIRPLKRLCHIPGASRVVPGVFYYRGEILSAHDLGCFLLEREGATEPPWVLVLQHQGERIGLLADSITNIVSVLADELRALPVTLGERSDCFYGLLEGGALLLNPARLLQNATFSSAF